MDNRWVHKSVEFSPIITSAPQLSGDSAGVLLRKKHLWKEPMKQIKVSRMGLVSMRFSPLFLWCRKIEDGALVGIRV